MSRLSLLLWCFACTALASSALQMDIPALTHAASDVVQGRVTATRTEWTADHRRLVTFVELDVLQTWKGRPPGRLTVVQPGGERDGLAQRVAGVAALDVGAELALFLERQGPLWRVVGLSQGVYRVERPADGSAARAVPVTVEGLRLVVPPGNSPRPRTAVLLEDLQGQVRREVQRE
jgi:hypothetical protein